VRLHRTCRTSPTGCFAIRSCRGGDVHPLVGIVIRDSAEDRLIPLGGIGGEVVGVGDGWKVRDTVDFLVRCGITLRIHL